MIELTGKGIKSIFRRANWKDRVYTDINGKPFAVDFNYGELRLLHIKNFKALFFKQYGFVVPDHYVIEIISDGDETSDDLLRSAHVLYGYLLGENVQWGISGHEDIFKFIIKDITENEASDILFESKNPDMWQAVAGVLVYHDDIMAVVLAGKKDWVDMLKPSNG